jgi:hypothetical protein
MTHLNDGTKHLTSHIMHGTISYGSIYWSLISVHFAITCDGF